MPFAEVVDCAWIVTIVVWPLRGLSVVAASAGAAMASIDAKARAEEARAMAPLTSVPVARMAQRSLANLAVGSRPPCG